MATKTSVKSAPAPKTSTAKSKAFRGAEQRYHQARRASILLKHVSDPTRLQVILILSEGERHVGALCAQLSQSQPAVSHHLALLRVSGLIESRREGKHNFYSVRTDHFGELLLHLFSAAGEVPRKVRFHDFVLTYSGE